eukprot:5558252-Amphidinium_carterae.9
MDGDSPKVAGSVWWSEVGSCEGVAWSGLVLQWIVVIGVAVASYGVPPIGKGYLGCNNVAAIGRA